MKTITSLNDVRLRSGAFVARREWAKFHQPINVCLALAGECGEVSEIFQWKTKRDPCDLEYIPFLDHEITHIGEELADVFIYSTRLCEICNCDLASAVRNQLAVQDGLTEAATTGLRCNSEGGWTGIFSSSLWSAPVFFCSSFSTVLTV
jgi:dCTP diphosphatase